MSNQELDKRKGRVRAEEVRERSQNHTVPQKFEMHLVSFHWFCLVDPKVI